MLLFIRIFLVLYGIIAAATGFLGVTASFDPTESPAMDNNHRFISAILGIYVYCFFLCSMESF